MPVAKPQPSIRPPLSLRFTSLDAVASDAAWQALFEQLWPAYESWYLRDGPLARPTYLICRRALRRYMPELVPIWERLVDLAGGGDMAARFLSLYRPPSYMSACSQAVWRGTEPMLVRNYDYGIHSFDAVNLRSHFSGSGNLVMGSSDCLIGLLDGVNSAGLCVSLTFGGSLSVGEGFGVPIILRYLLETCADIKSASAALGRIPCHMAYNVTLLDASGAYATAQLAPGRVARILPSPVATNHQQDDVRSVDSFESATVERERFLRHRLSQRGDTPEHFIAAFLQPPLYSLSFGRQRGTLYTAAYWPSKRRVLYRWPGAAWQLDLDHYVPDSRVVHYPAAAR